MGRILTCVLFAAALFAVFPCANFCAPQSSALTPDRAANIDRYVNAEIAREHIPGLALGVYSRGQILLAKGYGLSNIELDVPVKAETVFQSGSVGKQFVSAAIMLLVEENKISLDDSIVKYFPEAPEWWRPILIKNLLSHTSGLAEYESSERTGPNGPFYLRLDFTEDEMVKKIEQLPMEFKPGEKWNYRNTNYVLLGVIIHKITGVFYADYLQQRIFKPLGMTSTRLISEADIIPNRAAGYELHGDTLRNQAWVSPTFNSTADGALYFNVLDLAKWDEALYGTKLLKQSSIDRMWTVFPLNNGKPNSDNYGFAWEINRVNGHRVIGHGGEWQGFSCHISRYVDDGITVVVLTNRDSSPSEHIGQVVAGFVNPALEPSKTVAIKDDQPRLATQLGGLLDRIAAGQDVRSEFTSDLAAYFTPEVLAYFARTIKLIWPGSVSLVHRSEDDGTPVSRYRIAKNGETRIVTFGLAKDGKVAAFWIESDPDLR